MCALFGSDEPVVHAAPPLARYPSAEDAAFARKHGAFYGTAVDPYASGQTATMLAGTARGATPNQVTDPRLARTGPLSSFSGPNVPLLPDVYARAGLAANRSAVAGLGFDPRRFSMEPEMDADRTNTPGAYSSVNDHGFVVPGATDSGASTLIHESIHRGLQQMRAAGVLPQFDDKRQLDGRLEEAIVRTIMQRTMGDPEQGSLDLKAKRQAEGEFGRAGKLSNYVDRYVGDLESAAAQEVARRKPGGPR